jgi:hypothetical protein
MAMTGECVVRGVLSCVETLLIEASLGVFSFFFFVIHAARIALAVFVPFQL